MRLHSWLRSKRTQKRKRKREKEEEEEEECIHQARLDR